MSESSSDDAADRLEHVNDDLTPQQECLNWLTEQMWEGRDPDTLLTELVGNGWAEDEVQPLIDEARKQTRGSRSVLGSRNHAASGIRSHAEDILRSRHGLAAGAANASFGVFKDKLSQEANEVRHRIQQGLCYKCGHDVTGSADRCPKCGSAIVRKI